MRLQYCTCIWCTYRGYSAYYIFQASSQLPVESITMPTFEIHDEAWYPWVLGGYFALVIVTYLACARITAPYGRHWARGWGPTASVRESWIVMESPALWATVLFYSMGEQKLGRVPLIFLRLYQVHYFNRVLIYPLRMKGIRGKSMPLLVALCAFGFNILNSYAQGRWISNYGEYPDSWLTSPKFIIGVTIFFIGFIGNFWSDSILLSLRTDEDDRSYRIPQGGLFRLVSNANYFFEMVEWLGWAIMTWSPAALAFFLYTMANLVPRAKSNHYWYLKKFPDYPKERRILVPYLY
ncbi:hypothetical protein R1flu_001359 [Riccia fluitans]|uniref:Steroid 5-alpha-reductase DET2 n=1 Tax=Riccia fluitans TaxID=41844 RepID=A0ABD1Y725_9MARC